MVCQYLVFFFFKQTTSYEMRISDWSSDVCSSDLGVPSMTLSPFHLAIPVHDLAAARTFYGEAFGCAEGRSSEHWVDFDFFGHQLVIHEAPKMPQIGRASWRERVCQYV